MHRPLFFVLQRPAGVRVRERERPAGGQSTGEPIGLALSEYTEQARHVGCRM